MRPPVLVLVLALGCSSKDGDSGPGGDVCPVSAVAVEAGGEIALAQTLRVELEQASTALALCALEGDPEEVLLFESMVDGTSHDLELIGLAEDSTYTCEVRAGCEGAAPSVVEVVTPDLGLPAWTVSGSGQPDGAYTLFNTQVGCIWELGENIVYVVDPEGRVRWSWSAGTGYVADLDAAWLGDGRLHAGGGWGMFLPWQQNRGMFRTMTLTGEILVEREAPDFGLGFNHHSEVLDDGTVLGLTTTENTADGLAFFGVGIELWDPSTSAVAWSWDSQSLLDSGAIATPALEGDIESSPWHANSVTFHTDAHGEAAWTSLHLGQAIWRIDRTSGDLTHVLGPEGDFRLIDPEGQDLPPEAWFYGQHDPDYDGNRVLLYDNGDGRPGGSFSRVVELELDLDARTATLLWSWTEPGWYNPIVGDADWLPGGHALIAKGFSKCLSPGSTDGSSIVEVDPATDGVVWRLDLESLDHVIYRAERYDGCEIFANAKYCPEVAARVAALR